MKDDFDINGIDKFKNLEKVLNFTSTKIVGSEFINSIPSIVDLKITEPSGLNLLHKLPGLEKLSAVNNLYGWRDPDYFPITDKKYHKSSHFIIYKGSRDTNNHASNKFSNEVANLHSLDIHSPKKG